MDTLAPICVLGGSVFAQIGTIFCYIVLFSDLLVHLLFVRPLFYTKQKWNVVFQKHYKNRSPKNAFLLPTSDSEAPISLQVSGSWGWHHFVPFFLASLIWKRDFWNVWMYQRKPIFLQFCRVWALFLLHIILICFFFSLLLLLIVLLFLFILLLPPLLAFQSFIFSFPFLLVQAFLLPFFLPFAFFLASFFPTPCLIILLVWVKGCPEMTKKGIFLQF